jgi:Carboxypeptidase regulatory-like domain
VRGGIGTADGVRFRDRLAGEVMRTDSMAARAFGLGIATVIACLAGSVVPPSLGAQTIAGAVFDSNTSAPLPGVLVSLLDSNGERVRAVLSDEVGRFTIEVGGFGRFRLRGERIGLRTTTTDTFDLFSLDPRFERILMNDRAVEIEGLVVDSRVRQCRIDPESAVLIQRWWQEIRTALDVSTVVRDRVLARFQVERFEREWGPDLQRIISTDSRTETSRANRPFVSKEADFLADSGFVRGDLTGQREYYAPDAEVLLSDVFLSLHCFSITGSEDDERLVGLSFEPTRSNDIPEIRGTLWVDSTTAELQSLDYRYANMDELPENESGGFVSFEYLPSGAWIVRDWYIRMPRIGVQRDRWSDRWVDRLVVLGYTDAGGRVRRLTTAAGDADRTRAFGAIRGIVFDSIRGGGLAGATVSVLGARFRTTTDRSGGFVLLDVPVGEHSVSFSHPDPEAWGLGSPLARVEVEEAVTSVVYLALPGFRQAASVVCMGSGLDAESVLVGRVVDPNGDGLGNVALEMTWRSDREGGAASEWRLGARTGSDGRFVVCTIPGDVEVRVRANVEGRWVEGFEVPLPMREITYRQLVIPIAR